MGSFQSKDKSNPNPSEKDVEDLREKLRHLQEEINEIMCMRENENEAYEQEKMVVALKKVEWKREKKRLREEVKRLRKKLEEKERGIRGMEDELLGISSLVEHLRKERGRGYEAVEKWKKLYLAIKFELDDLIKRTYQGESLRLRAEEEDSIGELQRELKSREETIELLQARLALMEKEESRREREVDMLRQSFRIMSHKKGGKIC